jgi:hypothetical protein
MRKPSRRSKQGHGPRREKHSAFYRLVEACGQAECPICHLARIRVERYFDGLLYEKVNDPELRRRFRAAGGFCSLHSFQFLGYNDGLAGSILYRDLLTAWLEQQTDFPVQPTSGVLPGCPACVERARTEETCLGLLVEFLEEEQLKKALLASDGLCLPHLAALDGRLREEKRTIPSWLMDFQRELAERLVADLSAYLDACNFSLGSNRPTLSRQQELTWQRAVRKLAGFPAIPGKS